MTNKILFPLLFIFSLFFSENAFSACNNILYTTNQVGNVVTFTASVPAGYVINTYYWNFGDGGISNTPNPSHTYANGSYNACMTISGIDANNNIFQCTWCDSIVIGNNQPCNASFISTVSGNMVAFTNTATGPGVITGYNWTFGDGGTSTQPNPVHTYANTGSYNVCLTITGIDNGLSYTCTWCDSVNLGPNVNPCNNISLVTTQTGNTVAFAVTAPAGYNFSSYAWSFGDGGTSNAATPSHTYLNSGWYYACVTVTGFAMNTPIQCTICDSIYVGNNPPLPCNASFISTTSGLTAAFTNTATGPGVITGYNWTFGDGGTSALPNPTHTYPNSGWYNVCLTITGIDANVAYTCTWCDSIFVQGPGGNPCNNISFTTAQIGNNVTFNASVPAGFVPNAYSWTFGDGGTSNLPNPTHTYANNGWYLACLVISGIYNNTMITCTYCDSIYVGNIPPVPCNASFIFTTSGLTAAFTNTATGPGVITGYSWTFGDGGTSNLPNPAHTYANNGTYNVCLTITGIDNGLTYTCTWCDSLTVGANVNPCNNISFINTQAGNTVTFAVTAPAGYNFNTYAWNFGDGGTSNLASPSHTYLNNGWYYVCVTVTGFAMNTPIQCTICDSIYVGNNPPLPCNASFISTTSVLTAAFTNTATGPGVITGYAWTFGDGGTSALPNPTHTYANSGWYNVCLTITGIDNGLGYSCTWCDSIFVQGPGGNPCNSISFTTAQAGNNVTFNASVPAGFVPTTYNWTFGDGGTSALPNPTHTYANNGWYFPCLVITGIYNNTVITCTFCDSILVGNNPPLPCNASFISTTSGLTAAFTNTATGPGAITGYSWTFGDGGTSNLPNPSHTYATSGWYNVCLTITGIDNGMTYTCTWCDSLFVQGPAGNPCNGVSFNTTQTGNTATFNAVVPGGYVINTYYWTFGDGGNSNAANPSHTYANNGWYNVCMVVSGMANNNIPFQCSVCDSIFVMAAGVNDIDENNTLHVYPNPAANYLEITLPSKNNYSLRLYDVAGKLLQEKNITAGNEKYTLNTEGLSKGMYFIQLVSDNKKYQSNFVKQ